MGSLAQENEITCAQKMYNSDNKIFVLLEEKLLTQNQMSRVAETREMHCDGYWLERRLAFSIEQCRTLLAYFYSLQIVWLHIEHDTHKLLY